MLSIHNSTKNKLFVSALRNIYFLRIPPRRNYVRRLIVDNNTRNCSKNHLQLFLNPFPAQQNSYINFEMNPNGVFLTEFGSEREGRERLSRLTEQSPSVTPFTLPSPQGDAWGVLLFVPCELVESLYHQPFSIAPAAMAGNFYKCGDETAHPHFGAYFPVGSAELGFHNPQCFGRIELADKID